MDCSDVLIPRHGSKKPQTTNPLDFLSKAWNTSCCRNATKEISF